MCVIMVRNSSSAMLRLDVRVLYVQCNRRVFTHVLKANVSYQKSSKVSGKSNEVQWMNRLRECEYELSTRRRGKAQTLFRNETHGWYSCYSSLTTWGDRCQALIPDRAYRSRRYDIPPWRLHSMHWWGSKYILLCIVFISIYSQWYIDHCSSVFLIQLHSHYEAFPQAQWHMKSFGSVMFQVLLQTHSIKLILSVISMHEDENRCIGWSIWLYWH